MKCLAPILLSTAMLGCGSDAKPCDPTAPNTICTIAGNGGEGYDGDKGNALDATLYVPEDTIIAPDGELWISDFNNYRIRAVHADGKIDTVMGTGFIGDSPVVGQEAQCQALVASFNHTPSMVVHGTDVYFAAWHNSRVKKLDTTTMTLTNFAGIGARTYYAGDEGPAMMATLDLPSSITVAPNGNVAIMDQANQVIREVDQDGNIHRLAGMCMVDSDVQCAEGQAPTQCPFSNKWTCGDLGTECSNPCTPSYSGDGGPALEMRMAQPYGQAADPAGRMAYDNDGNLIFADSNNDRVRKIDTNGIVTTIAGTGVTGYSGDGGDGTLAQVNRPIDIAIGDDNSIYFSDTGNSCIRKIMTDGTISTVAGKCDPKPANRGFDGDGGPPSEALLNRPYGIDLHGKKLYISDSYNSRVRVVNLP